MPTPPTDKDPAWGRRKAEARSVRQRTAIRPSEAGSGGLLFASAVRRSLDKIGGPNREASLRERSRIALRE